MSEGNELSRIRPLARSVVDNWSAQGHWPHNQAKTARLALSKVKYDRPEPQPRAGAQPKLGPIQGQKSNILAAPWLLTVLCRLGNKNRDNNEDAPWVMQMQKGPGLCVFPCCHSP